MPRNALLFVDDEPTILYARKLIFEHFGYSVFTAESGKDALQLLVEHPIEAVILDYIMPGMNGEETARQIRRLLPDIPIILSSGCPEIPKTMLAFVDAISDKVEHPDVLRSAIEQCIARQIKAATEDTEMASRLTPGWRQSRT